MNTQFLRGMCYEAFPQGYNPSTANNTCIFFGSDIASYNMKPLWGPAFSPIDGPDKDKIFIGRNDIVKLYALGVNFIRLYDWDARANHIPFLDYCFTVGIKVLVPVSNYNFGAYGTPPPMDESILGLLKSFMDKKGNDYHPAIYGISFGNELDLPSQMPKGYLVDYTKRWVELEQQVYPGCRKVPVGHPVSFAKPDKNYPCFTFWNDILPALREIKTGDLDKRLMLCPHTYNDATYLFENAEGDGKGWVDITYDTYKLPILFCEIGCSRLVRKDYIDIVAKQLENCWIYAQDNPEKLLGTCYFQYCDKVWAKNTTEGSYGVYHVTDTCLNIVRYGLKDFTYLNKKDCIKQSLKISHLGSNIVFNTIKLIYTSDKLFI